MSNHIAAARDFLLRPPPAPTQQVQLQLAPARARSAHPFQRRGPRRRRHWSHRQAPRPAARLRLSVYSRRCGANPTTARLVRRRQRRHRIRVLLRQRRQQRRSPLRRLRPPAATAAAPAAPCAAALERPAVGRRRPVRDEGRSWGGGRDQRVLAGEDMPRDRDRSAGARRRPGGRRRMGSSRRRGQRRFLGFVVGRDRAVEVPRPEQERSLRGPRASDSSVSRRGRNRWTAGGRHSRRAPAVVARAKGDLA